MNSPVGVAYISVLSGLIKLISAGCQVGLQRVVVVSQPVNLTLEVFLSLLTFVVLILQRFNLKVAFVGVLQQLLNLSIINSGMNSARMLSRQQCDNETRIWKAQQQNLCIIKTCQSTTNIQ